MLLFFEQGQDSLFSESEGEIRVCAKAICLCKLKSAPRLEKSIEVLRRRLLTTSYLNFNERAVTFVTTNCFHLHTVLRKRQHAPRGSGDFYKLFLISSSALGGLISALGERGLRGGRGFADARPTLSIIAASLASTESSIFLSSVCRRRTACTSPASNAALNSVVIQPRCLSGS